MTDQNDGVADAYFFSPSAGGFFHPSVHGDQIPQDCVAVSPEVHAALISAQAAGKIIAFEGGAPVAVDPPPPTLAQLVAAGGALVQAHLDATARERRYDGIQTAVSYRDDPNPVFAAEGQALFAWRSAVWTAALAILADVEAGTRPLPAAEAFIGELPAMVWPEIA